MLHTDATTRFSQRVDDYVRYRPGYPAAVVELLAREAGLTADSTIADIGSGTGFLSRPFLDAGYAVVGVEPNADMRRAGDELLSAYPRFRSVGATAEATTLDTGSLDLIVAGQAFHWFDPAPTRREWARLFRPGAAGIAALIWNERFIECPFMQEVEDLINVYAAEMDKDGSIREAGRSRIPGFFAPASYTLTDFPNHQLLDRDGLIGRVASSSFLPGQGHSQYEPMTQELTAIFERHQHAGEVSFAYRTKVFWGRLT